MVDEAEKCYTSPYFAFADLNRYEATTRYPKLSSREMSKKLGELWKAMPELEKQRYRDIAAESRASSSASKPEAAAPKGRKRDRKKPGDTYHV
jgi:hypothetical protein